MHIHLLCMKTLGNVVLPCMCANLRRAARAVTQLYEEELRQNPQADAAATIIANAVDLPGHPAIRRAPAKEIAPDSDLAERLVTREVGALTAAEISRALEAGQALADSLIERGLIHAAALCLQSKVGLVAHPPGLFEAGVLQRSLTHA